MEPDPLFDLALEPLREQLRLAGAWRVTGSLTGWWRMPDGRILTEEEALAWLRREQEQA
jgi:hypothetical protein